MDDPHQKWSAKLNGDLLPVYASVFRRPCLHGHITFTYAGSLGTKWKGRGEEKSKLEKEWQKKHDDMISSTA